jgi:hypothetical protein
MSEKLILRAALIVSKHLSRSEHFKEFVRKFHSNPLPTQVEEILKTEIDGYSQNNALPESIVELREALFVPNGHDPNVLVENYLSQLRANQSPELRELLSQIEMELDFVLDAPISAASDAEQHLFSEFPEPFWNTENLTNTELRTEIRQVATRFLEELDESDQILTEQLDEVAPLLEQLHSLNDADVPFESGPGAISPEAAQAISEIVDAVSNVSDEEGELEDVLMDSLEKIVEFNLDPKDVKDALHKEITSGVPSTLHDSFDPQGADNCVIAISKVVGAQFGKHVPEGVLTLHAILDGKLGYNIHKAIVAQCTKITEICFFTSEPRLDVTGTKSTFLLTDTLHTLGVPVDIDYNATLDEVVEKLSQGKSVIVTLNVKPLSGKDAYHVVQVASIDEENGRVTTLDTGSKDALGNPDGNHKVYDLEKFEEARELGGSAMISTEAARPSAARVNGELDEVDEEGRELLNGVPSQKGETGPGETETPANTRDDTDSQDTPSYGKDHDERDGTEKNDQEPSPHTFENTSTGIEHDPINNQETTARETTDPQDEDSVEGDAAI